MSQEENSCKVFYGFIIKNFPKWHESNDSWYVKAEINGKSIQLFFAYSKPGHESAIVAMPCPDNLMKILETQKEVPYRKSHYKNAEFSYSRVLDEWKLEINK